MAFDPTARAEGPDTLLIKKDLLTKYLLRKQHAIGWAIIGKKEVFGVGITRSDYSSLQMSARLRDR